MQSGKAFSKQLRFEFSSTALDFKDKSDDPEGTVTRIDESGLKGLGWRPVLRLSLGVLGLFCCYRLAVGSARAGLSRLYSTLAIIGASVEPADEAVRLAPNDPEAHYTRALSLVNLERLSEAVVELREATQLRPHHYYEWLDLGVTLDRLGDQAGAENALRIAVRLAPSFAQPRWQLGNLFYRQGRFPEAFVELRQGARSNPNLVEGIMQLAWVAGNGDVEAIKGLIQPQNQRSHFELASFLAKQGKAADAAGQARDAGVPETEEERALSHQTISALLAADQFSDAYSAWAAAHGLNAESSLKTSGQLLNGNFMEPIVQDDPGFGWQTVRTQNVIASIDLSGPSNAARSVRLEFGGVSASGSQLIQQILLLQPNSRYSLSFMSRAEDLVTGGPPVILILGAGTKATKVLGQSEPLSPGTPPSARSHGRKRPRPRASEGRSRSSGVGAPRCPGDSFRPRAVGRRPARAEKRR